MYLTTTCTYQDRGSVWRWRGASTSSGSALRSARPTWDRAENCRKQLIKPEMLETDLKAGDLRAARTRRGRSLRAEEEGSTPGWLMHWTWNIFLQQNVSQKSRSDSPVSTVQSHRRRRWWKLLGHQQGLSSMSCHENLRCKNKLLGKLL